MKDQLEYDEEMRTFLKDQRIEDAYQRLKPKVDELHEVFITVSLESVAARNIDFSNYYTAYNERKDNPDALKTQEKELREKISELYIEGDKVFREKYPDLEWKKASNAAKGHNILFTQDILEVVRLENKDVEQIQKDLEVFSGFFTYFGGYNQNRENYYETGKEASTAVATRIVHENLPKFCDNVDLFINHQDEYLKVYETLRESNIALIDKDENALYPINGEIFKIEYFANCLSQQEVEAYNDKIGNANFLINLYNQRQGKDSKRLLKFKTLYKQIGCGKRASLFFTLKYDKESELNDKEKDRTDEVFSVEKVLDLAKKGASEYFAPEQNKRIDGEIQTVFAFTNWLRNIEDWSGFYWSKAAINTISNKYFLNWHNVIDKLKEQRDETIIASTNEQSDQIKIRDAVELSGLFSVLDSLKQDDNWSNILFKEAIIAEKGIDKSKSPGWNLINLLCLDIEQNAKAFLGKIDDVVNLSNYKSEEGKKAIKECMDYALAVNQIIKYFRVKANKTKGANINSELERALENLLDNREGADWFGWYDALRNYLTKKPQDDAKENKLKLNFECPILLGGWSDGQEKSKKSVLLKNDNKYYLGILKKSNLFDTSKDENPIYKKGNSSSGRLVLANLKFQTLAGRGFIRDYNQSYGDMGKEEPLQAVRCLQELIAKQYVQKYPLLKKVLKKYSEKKKFDKDIQEVLKECYVCEFVPIDWALVNSAINKGDLYVFEIVSKDTCKNSTGKTNMQTMYWENVFALNSPHQLNGGGEVFYRQKAINKKRVKKGYEDKPWVIEGRRFTENEALEQGEYGGNTDGKSFFFHCPIKLNYKAKSYRKPEYSFGEINETLNQWLTNSEEIYFLGLDRGEKHLVYYSLVDSNGTLIKQGSFNVINSHNYLEKLAIREGERHEARKSWQRIESIKELKEGYISQVVHEIANVVQEKPTFIVLEDLNTGFKRGRQKIERQVYQKFELALAKKLNFLVDKTAKSGELGSVTNALQLTPPVQNYGDIENRKQAGIMFYTRANYTSQTDPLTGWRKTIYLKKGSEAMIWNQIENSFDEIGFKDGHYYFEYKDEKTGKKWKLWSGHDDKPLLRYRGKRGKDKNEWIIDKVDVEDLLDGLFEGFDKSQSILQQLKNGKSLNKITNDYTAWESLRFVVDIIQQIRNSGNVNKDQDDNFLLSPVRDENGNYYDSRDYVKKEAVELPKDADANGAYNIARKGIIMNAHIQTWIANGKPKNGKSSDLNLLVSDGEWDLYLADPAEWEKRLPVFSSKKAMSAL